ncbi:MAG: hypothetical protein KGR48_00315 [Alphaproteobacteria bacterium]|nr:hypothetical protein [Alphaproteobacteria bacterium]MDE2014657.1 hypothetical protein [Alphaproteobacteria bacterium]MDE2073879.1 hypothetical protein [Alphaproteobacteria bacterium]
MRVTWRWLAAAVAVCPQATLAAATAGAPLVQVHAPDTDLSISGGAAPGNSPGVKGEADLTLGLAGVTTDIKGTALAGNSETTQQGDAWSSGAVSIDTHWQSGPATWDLQATQSFRHSLFEGTRAGALTSLYSEQQSEQNSSRGTVALRPLTTLGLTLGAESQDTSTIQGQWQVSAKQQKTRVETSSERAFAKANWSPVTAVSLDGEVAVAATSMALDGTASGRTQYQALEPRLGVTLKPWTGSQLAVSVEKTVTPLDPGNFAAYVAATGRPEDMPLKPDSARAVNVAVKQTLGSGISVETAYRDAALDSTTALVPAASGETPASISGGNAQSIRTQLTLSLAALGLPATSVSSNSVWRHSWISDPVTGREHSLSGEIPQETQLSLTHAMPQQHLTWGLNGTLGAQTSYYQAAELSTVTSSGSFGAFVQYDPGPFSLRFHVDGLAGTTDRRDIFYSGSRANGLIDHVGNSQADAPTVGLSLVTALNG